MCWPQGFVEHIFQMEKISEPLTGIEPMTLRTLVRCSNHWATKDIVAQWLEHPISVRKIIGLIPVGGSDTCIFFVSCSWHIYIIFQYSSYFLSEAKFMCFCSQTHGSMPCLFKIVSRANPCTKPHYWSLLADTYVLCMYFRKPCILWQKCQSKTHWNLLLMPHIP